MNAFDHRPGFEGKECLWCCDPWPCLVAKIRHECAEKIRDWERNAQTLLPLERGAAQGCANMIDHWGPDGY